MGRKQKEGALMGSTEEIKLFDIQENLLERKGEVNFMAPPQFLTVKAGGDNR